MFHENMSSGFKVMEWTRKIVNTQKGNNSKVEKPDLRFMCSARCLMVFKVCVKFHENMSSGFKAMEWTRKLLTDTHTHTHTRKRRMLCGYNYLTVGVIGKILSQFI